MNDLQKILADIEAYEVDCLDVFSIEDRIALSCEWISSFGESAGTVRMISKFLFESDISNETFTYIVRFLNWPSLDESVVKWAKYQMNDPRKKCDSFYRCAIEATNVDWEYDELYMSLKSRTVKRPADSHTFKP